MNFRHRYLRITIQTLLGLLLIFTGVMGLINGASTENVPPTMVPVLQTFWQTGILPVVKVLEVITGLMLVTCLLPALAVLFFAPIAVGIMAIHLTVAPETLPFATIVALMTAYLGYAYWDKYRGLFVR